MPLNDILNPALFLLGLGLTLTYFPWPDLFAFVGWSTVASGSIEILFKFAQTLLEGTVIGPSSRDGDGPSPALFTAVVPQTIHYLQHIINADVDASIVVSKVLDYPSFFHPPGTEIPLESLVHRLVVEILHHISLENGFIGLDQSTPRRECYLSLYDPWSRSTPGWQALDVSATFREFSSLSGRLFGVLLYPTLQAFHDGSLLVTAESDRISNIMERGSALFVAGPNCLYSREGPSFHTNPTASFDVDLEAGGDILALDLAEFNRTGGTWFKSLTRVAVEQVLQKWDIVPVENHWVARAK